jgi:hypothetical protein
MDHVATFRCTRRTAIAARQAASAAADRYIAHTLAGCYIGSWQTCERTGDRWLGEASVMYEPLMTDGTTHVEAHLPQHCPDGAPL